MTPNNAWHWLIPKPSRPTAGSAIPLSDEMIDWLATIHAAGEDFAIPALAKVLENSGLLDQAPSDVQQFLRYALAQNAQANIQIREQCLDIGNAFAGAGLKAMLLKGACWLFED